MVIVDRPVHTQGEADRMAQAIADDLSGNYIRADGQTGGKPQLRAGSKVNISAVGDRFSGEYFVTRATHTYAPEQRYTVQFTVTGRRPLTLGLLLTGQERSRGSQGSRVPGVSVGVVTNNDDPDGMGRVKVKLPWMADDAESFWARQASPMAGSDRGFFWLPEVNDEVLVAFEHNDINYPYIIGALWNGQDRPPQGTGTVLSSSGAVDQRVIRTRVGHLIVLDDSSGQPGISIIDKTGNNVILIESNPNKITTMADQDIVIKASQGKVQISAQQGIEITTPQKIDIQGSTGVDVKGDGPVKIESGSNLEVKASAMTTIKGSMVKIN